MPANTKDLSESEMLSQLVDRMDKLIAITSLQGRSKEEQIERLAGMGYSNSEMASMLVLPKGTVDGIRANLSKPKKK